MSDYRTRQRYGARHQPDNLTRAGAEALADKIRAFWFRKGKFPNVNISKERVRGVEGAAEGLYCVRSDIFNGAPR